MDLIFRVLVTICAAYLFGSVQIAPILLRQDNTKRAADSRVPLGRQSVSRFVVVYDILKGLVAMPLFGLLIQGEAALIFLPVIAFIVGQRFPLFFRFRGGTIVAPLVGLLLFSIASDTYAGGIYWHTSVIALTAGIALFISTRNLAVPGIIVTFLLTTMSVLAFSFTSLRVAIFSVLLFGFAVDSSSRQSLLEIPKGEDIKIWRIAARPFALLFIVIDVIWHRRITLLVIGSLALIFVAMDLVRLFSKRSSKAIFKSKEKNRFSSMTLFLVATTISFLVFSEGIPYVALTCITIGDFFGKIVGMQYGKTYLFRHKTLEGTLAFFSGSVTVTYVVGSLFGIPIAWIVIGSAIAAVTELFSDHIDDNFTVSIVVGGALTAVRLIGI